MTNTQQVFSVSEITRRIKGILESGLPDVTIQGEVSNCKLHTSGHLYFTLKDEHSQLAAVMWRSRVAHLFFKPEDGMKVVARGAITVYEVRGVYQIDVVFLQPLGVGELQLLFEKLKQKLAAEGLFSEAHKKPIPHYPRRIGIVTSPTGAAIRDMITVISRRFPSLEVILRPASVQGPGAAEDIATAIREFNEYQEVDVLIVGRGGGSLEDLWAFNEEVVARAIYDSRIPVVSAVGHEIDFTIADFVSDLRAPTPSAAAELVVPSKGELVDIMRNFCYTAGTIISRNISSEKDSIAALIRSHSFNRPSDLLREHMQHLDELKRSLTTTVLHQFTLLRHQLNSLGARLQGLSPEAVLERGYAIVHRDGELIGRAKQLRRADRVDIKFHDGGVSAEIT